MKKRQCIVLAAMLMACGRCMHASELTGDVADLTIGGAVEEEKPAYAAELEELVQAILRYEHFLEIEATLADEDYFDREIRPMIVRVNPVGRVRNLMKEGARWSSRDAIVADVAHLSDDDRDRVLKFFDRVSARDRRLDWIKRLVADELYTIDQQRGSWRVPKQVREQLNGLHYVAEAVNTYKDLLMLEIAEMHEMWGSRLPDEKAIEIMVGVRLSDPLYRFLLHKDTQQELVRQLMRLQDEMTALPTP